MRIIVFLLFFVTGFITISHKIITKSIWEEILLTDIFFQGKVNKIKGDIVYFKDSKERIVKVDCKKIKAIQKSDFNIGEDYFLFLRKRKYGKYHLSFNQHFLIKDDSLLLNVNHLSSLQKQGFNEELKLYEEYGPARRLGYKISLNRFLNLIDSVKQWETSICLQDTSKVNLDILEKSIYRSMYLNIGCSSVGSVSNGTFDDLKTLIYLNSVE